MLPPPPEPSRATDDHPGFTEVLDPAVMLGGPMTGDHAAMDEIVTKTVKVEGRRRRGKRPGKLTLRVRGGPEQGRQETIEASRVRVGRGPSADFSVDHPSLSGLHFELRIRKDGIDLFDLRSKNGTWLRDRRVFHVGVEPGDVIVAGDCQIELVEAVDVETLHADEAREDGLLGISDAITEVFAALDTAAPTHLPVLVTGETGTGKGLVARAIHRRSQRAGGPFVLLDCATLQAGLAASTIAGHRKGAFTGADSDHAGAFEHANGGTIFLDEIGDVPIDLQPKLLRVLESGTVTRLGDQEPTAVDVRVIAATHRNLATMVDAGTFREDLYYRLAGFSIELPSLRERGPAEIEYLARTMLAGDEDSGATPPFDDDALTALRTHRWPGNVRELSNAITRARSLAGSDPIGAKHLMLRPMTREAIRIDESLRFASYTEVHEEVDRYLLPRVLADCGGDIAAAARLLGKSELAVRRRMAKLGIVVA